MAPTPDNFRNFRKAAGTTDEALTRVATTMDSVTVNRLYGFSIEPIPTDPHGAPMDHQGRPPADAQPQGPPLVGGWAIAYWFALRLLVGLTTIMAYVFTFALLAAHVAASPLVVGDCRCLSVDGIVARLYVAGMVAGGIGWILLARELR